MGIRVYKCDATSALHIGRNVLAIEAVRGPDATNQNEDWISPQQSHGQVLAAMILPAALGIKASPLVMSDAEWKAEIDAAPAGWQNLDFDDSTWPNADQKTFQATLDERTFGYSVWYRHC